jgi:hypothetical protein
MMSLIDLEWLDRGIGDAGALRPLPRCWHCSPLLKLPAGAGPQARCVGGRRVHSMPNGGPLMSGIVKASIVFSITNYAFSFFVIGLIFALASIARAGRTDRNLIVEKLLAWHVFWSIGACYLLNFVFHGFYGQMAASFIGWSDSPFQFEVATASLGFSLVGFLAAWGSRDFRIAAILGPAVFTLGAAAGHVHQMVTAHNFAPGNAGLIFYTDIGLPLFGFTLLWLQARGESADNASVARTQTLRSANS